MEINADTTGGQAAAALTGVIAPPVEAASLKLTVEQEAAIKTAVGALLEQAGIADSDPVQVHFAANPEGKWAVLRVAVVLEGA